MTARLARLALCLGVIACSVRPQNTAQPAASPVGPGAGAWSPLSEPPADPGGIGSIEARTAQGDPGHVSLQKVMVRAEQAGEYASVSVEHVFRSEADVPLEGTFRAPMPAGAILTGLAMLVDGKLVEGELVEREKARRVFEQIEDAMQDPALLEWEHGTTFKMRVFPLEPHQSKVVTLRYLVPLGRRGNGFVFAQGTRTLDGSARTPSLTVEWNGKRVFQETNVSAGRVLETKASEPARAHREAREDGAYTAVRFTPDWSKVPVDARPVPRNWLVVVDTSRSSLEERKLELVALRSVLSGLDSQSRFQLFASDLDTEPRPGGWVAPTPGSIVEAVGFVEARSPDGATDLGAMLHRLGPLARQVGNAGVIYIGDCEPTWGQIDPAKLVAEARAELGTAPAHVLVLGSTADGDFARELSAATGGRTQRAQSPEDVVRFTQRVQRSPKRLTNLSASAGAEAVVLPAHLSVLEEPDESVFLVKTPRGQLPSVVTVSAEVGGQRREFTERLQPRSARFVAQRFGAEWIRELERRASPKETIVQASQSYGVMSKYTSFLVLESEEAYARFAIERRVRSSPAEAPRVTGANLQSPAGDSSMSIDRMQPGDPEIYVLAPVDAQSVVIRFPWGETKPATYDDEANAGRGAWFVRFLVSRDTREGAYHAIAHIVQANGAEEDQKVSYTVDRSPPKLEVTVRPVQGQPGRFEILVTQAGPEKERDLKRVEVRAPDGQILTLTAIRWAEFRGYWRPTLPVTAGKLRVVGFDLALNHSAVEVDLP